MLPVIKFTSAPVFLANVWLEFKRILLSTYKMPCVKTPSCNSLICVRANTACGDPIKNLQFFSFAICSPSLPFAPASPHHSFVSGAPFNETNLIIPLPHTSLLGPFRFRAVLAS